MAHGLDDVETERAAALPRGAAERILALVNGVVVKASSVALVASGFVLTYSVIVRYFLKISTDWQDEMSVFLIVGAVFMSAAAVQSLRGHVAIETIIGLLPARVNRARQILVDVASLIF
jgi:TRAP-type C4-dicarboxylate transport system permease small subunit